MTSRWRAIEKTKVEEALLEGDFSKEKFESRMDTDGRSRYTILNI